MLVQEQIRQALGIQKSSEFNYEAGLDLSGYLSLGDSIGVGGYGDVYRGLWVNVPNNALPTDQDANPSIQLPQIVIKQLRPIPRHDEDKMRSRLKDLKRELKVWQQLDHPNIVPFIGTATLSASTNNVCILSSFMENGRVSDYLKTHPKSNRTRLLREIADGLAYLHARRIIHGDLKSANVLVDLRGTCQLCDFGLSKILEVDSLWYTTASEARGTVRWQSPELICGEEKTATMASDVWSYGMTAFEILSGNIPFHNIRDWTIAGHMLHHRDTFRPRRDQAPYATPQLWQLCESCWKTSPADRLSAFDIFHKLSTILLDLEDTEVPSLLKASELIPATDETSDTTRQQKPQTDVKKTINTPLKELPREGLQDPDLNLQRVASCLFRSQSVTESPNDASPTTVSNITRSSSASGEEGGQSGHSREQSTASMDFANDDSDPFAVWRISDSLNEATNDMDDTKHQQKLVSDYNELVNLLDKASYDGWRSVAGTLDVENVIEQLVVTANDQHPEEVDNLSHQLILRFVLCGFIEFSRATQRSIKNKKFLHEHAKFLALKYPAALLLTVLYTNDDKEGVKRFENYLKTVRGKHPRREPVQDCGSVMMRYVKRFDTVHESIRSHAAFLIENLQSAGDREAFSDISIFTGFLPWLNFQMNPLIEGNNWSCRSLAHDSEFLALAKDTYNSPTSKFRLMKIMSEYYSIYSDRTAFQPLMMYLYVRQHFEVDSEQPLAGAYNEIARAWWDFCLRGQPEHFRMQTYYACTHGDTIIWVLKYLNDPLLIYRFVSLILQNLASWSEVKENSSLQYGMVRTLYLALRECGVKEFVKKWGPDEKEITGMAWHLGRYFKSHPSSVKLSQPNLRVTFNDMNTETDPGKFIRQQISSLLKFGSAIPEYEDIPLDRSTDYERWVQKLRLSTLILRMFVEAGVASEVYGALTAISTPAKLLTPFMNIRTYLSTSDDPELLNFLLEKLRRWKRR